MEIRCLGPLKAFEAAEPMPLGGPKQRLVLAHLLIRANRVVPIERLIDQVWDADPPSAARSSVQSYVSNLRRALGGDRIERNGHGYALRVASDEVDRLRAEQALDRARRLRPTEPAAAGRLLGDALDLWRGPPFADLADAPSLQPETTRLDELRLAILEERIGADLDDGRAHEVIGELETLTRQQPLRERLWGQLVVALYRCGRQAEALAAYDRARSVLAEQLGIDPSPELRSLHERVLRQDPSLHEATSALRGYRLHERLGSGSFGAVWRATQPGTDREVVVKVCGPELANQPDVIRSFEARAARVARIEHPHVVPLHDFWREPDGAYLVLRYLRGGDLRALLEGDVDPAAARRIAVQITEALAAAHRGGVAHGGVTAGNVLLDADGNAYVTDFSIISDRPPDPAGDVRALGRVLRALLAGGPEPVREVLDRATAEEPAARHREAVTLLVDLRHALDEVEVVAERADGAAGPGRSRRLRNPFKGLRAFTEADSSDFFGREAVVARLLGRLREPGPRFLAVVGPSGGGKSSVVHAGLVPAVRAGALPDSETWFVVPMVPGERPFDELASALRAVAVDPPDDLATRLGEEELTAIVARLLPAGGDLLLVVDQLEELFTLVPDAATRRRFIDQLVSAVSADHRRVRIVVTLRADFADRPLVHRGLAELMQSRSELLVPLSAQELERAVVGPAEQVGVPVEPALVAQLVADVADQPGALPLLQYALTELFERLRGGTLTAAGYQEIGGVPGALARRAEAIVTGLDDDERNLARQLLLRLVTPGHGVGDGVGDTRRRAPRTELVALAPSRMPAILRAFGDARLLSFDRDVDTREPTVEVAHEALLREWGRLRRWIDAARHDLDTQHRLRAAADDWIAVDRDPSFLATGARLDQYERWRATSGITPGAAEDEYLDASLEARDRVRAEEAARRRHEAALERRAVRRLRVLVAVLSTAALVAAGLTVFAVRQAERAARQAQVATARELTAAAVANLDVDPERSILLALEAVERSRDASVEAVLVDAEEALHRAVTASRVAFRVPGIGGTVDWNPVSDEFVTEGPEDSGLIDIRDGATGEPVRAWRGHDIDINDVSYSADGSLLVTTGDDGAVRAWDPRNERQAGAYATTSGEVWGAAASPDGTLMAGSWFEDKVVRIVEVTSGRVRHEVDIGALRTAFSPDGTRLAIAERRAPGAASTATVIDVDSGEQVLTIEHDTEVHDVSWSPDGQWLVTSAPSEARLHDAGTGRLR